MNFGVILERLQMLGVPYAHNEFKDTKKNPAPDPPFVVWLKSERARGADNKNNLLEVSASIELYTAICDDELSYEEMDEKRELLEMQIENIILPDIEYQKFNAPIRSEKMMQTAYEFTFLQKGSAKNER